MRPPGADHGHAPDRRDAEKERLKRQLEGARVREGRVRAEERERFSGLSASSKAFQGVTEIEAATKVVEDREQEAVRNAVARPGCASISVELDVRPEQIVGRAEDDGRGFDGNGGVGLRPMRERAALLDGALDLGCGPGGGARVAIAVPPKGRR